MKVVFVNPAIPSQKNASLARRLSYLAKFMLGKEIEVSSPWPPLGILYLGTILRQNGYDVSLLDAGIKHWSHDKTLNWIKKEDPDVVGITSNTSNFLCGIEIAKKVRKDLPNSKIIMGGPLVTFASEETLREYPFIDFVVRGEAEETILELMDAFQGNKKLRDIDGISFIKNKEIIHTSSRKINLNIDKIPFPDRSLIKSEYGNMMTGITFTTGKYTIAISSRGCPFNCTFCSAAAFRNKICSFRSPENFVDELELLVSQGYENIGILDDNFTLNERRVEKICKLIKRRNLEFHWLCEGRVDTANYNLLKKMKDVGCEIIYFGIESASQRILNYYKKNITPKMSIKAVNAAKKAKMNIVGSFIVGAPIETKIEVIKTLNFIKKLPIDVPQINTLGVWSPGTVLWDELTSKNPELKKYWKTRFTPVELGMCQYPAEWLDSVIEKTYRKFLLNANYILTQTVKTLTDPYRLELTRKWFFGSIPFM